MKKESLQIYIGTRRYSDQFQRLLESFIESLHREQVTARSLVGLSVQDPLLFLAAYLGCRRIGAVPVIIGILPDAQARLRELQLAYYCHEQEGALRLERLGFDAGASLPADVAVIIRTTGSVSGIPKFVMWTEQGLQYQHRETVKRLTYTVHDRLCLCVPLWGAYGASVVNILEHHALTLILPESIRPASLIRLFKEMEVTLVEGASSFYSMLAEYFSKHPEAARGVERVRSWGCGGDILPVSLNRKWIEAVGLPLLDGYGLSEAGPNVALSAVNDYKLGSVGRPLDGTEIRIDGEGELLLRGPGIMKGYYPLDYDGERPFTEDGWLRTGDLATVDEEGYLTIQGRIKNIIVVKETNVSPEHVEQALRQCGGIRDAAVVGIPHKNGGSRLVALLLAEESGYSLERVKQHAREHLEPASRPSQYRVMDQFPMLPNGKINRPALRELAAKLCGEEVMTAPMS
ncbi:long-chain fatty acid--CoA ligase [Paenibacillus dendritiformis]|uniref:class I adenylate-forming enzyme family protein n=1 Tax=Paenibacillus dendritiformis TaxID=130049 RepID=UPI00105A8378|nr:fatty acid--CoA ligase family protein [Paenibacillus dendritiformis]TDL50317.1 long-chain fatty acid--CoA ligase [Paenibacillus dendritiformis]